jgi:voltage-gated potassium channel Kch
MVLSKEEKSASRKRLMHLYSVAGVVLLMFLISVIEVLAWSLTYLWLGALESLEKATYFSMVTFTTLGYGEIVLDEQWRLLASFEAANGIIMFGWTTAIVLAAVQRIYFHK